MELEEYYSLIMTSKSGLEVYSRPLLRAYHGTFVILPVETNLIWQIFPKSR